MEYTIAVLPEVRAVAGEPEAAIEVLLGSSRMILSAWKEIAKHLLCSVRTVSDGNTQVCTRRDPSTLATDGCVLFVLSLHCTTNVLPGCYPNDHPSKRRPYLCDTGLLNMKALPHFGTGQLVPG